MRKVKASSYIVMGIMAIALVVVVSSIRMEHWKSKLLPLIISSIMLILGAIELRTGIFKPVESKDENIESRRILRGYLVTGGWVVGFLIGVYLLGFLIAIPLFTLSYMKLHGSTWLGAFLLSIVLLGFMYVISEPLAHIKLYRGLIPIFISGN